MALARREKKKSNSNTCVLYFRGCDMTRIPRTPLKQQPASVNNELESCTHANEATLAGLSISFGYLRARVSAEKLRAIIYATYFLQRRTPSSTMTVVSVKQEERSTLLAETNASSGLVSVNMNPI